MPEVMLPVTEAEQEFVFRCFYVPQFVIIELTGATGLYGGEPPFQLWEATGYLLAYERTHLEMAAHATCLWSKARFKKRFHLLGCERGSHRAETSLLSDCSLRIESEGATAKSASPRNIFNSGTHKPSSLPLSLERHTYTRPTFADVKSLNKSQTWGDEGTL